jgi:hypothetical protein
MPQWRTKMRDAKRSGYRAGQQIALTLVTILCLLGVGFSQSVHQLYYDNSSWTDADLTALAEGVTPNPLSVTAFYTTPNDQLHVYYVAQATSHIHQLYQITDPTITWLDQDLTQATSGENASLGSLLSGFSIGNAQYVYFCGDDSVIHEYSYGNNGNSNWVDTPLPEHGYSKTCGQFGAENGSLVLAFPAAYDNQRFVYYAVPQFLDGKATGYSDLQQLYFDGVGWTTEDLTQTIHGAGANEQYAVSGFATGDFPFLFFTASDNKIHEFYDAGGGWTKQIVNNGDTAGVPAAYAVPGTTEIAIDYFAANGDLSQETYANGKWGNVDLSSKTGCSFFSFTQAIVGFATTPNNQFHVYSLGSDGYIDQLYYNGEHWTCQPLPSALAPATGPLAGFSIGNLQYVYYID